MNSVTLGLIKFIKSIWPVLVYIFIGLILIGRWEKNEQKRMEEASERDKLKRIHNQKYISSRHQKLNLKE